MAFLSLLAATTSPAHDPTGGGGGLFEEEGGLEDDGLNEDFEQIEIPSKIETAEDAVKTLHAIKGVAGNLNKLDSRTEQVQRACDDLMRAVGVLQAANAEKPTSSVGSNERDLTKYLRADGTLRLLAEESTFSYAGQSFKMDLPGLLDDAETTCSWQADLKSIVKERQWAGVAQKARNTPYLDAKLAYHMLRAPKVGDFAKGLEEHAKKAFESRKAFNNSSATGAEWIPESFVPDLYEAQVLRGPVADQFTSVQVGSDTFKRPRVSNQIRLYVVSQITTDDPTKYTASTPATGEQTYTVPMGGILVLVDVAASEDSAVAAIPVLQRLMNDTRNDAYADAILNGDTTATHEDTIATWNTRSRWGSSGLGGSADHRRIFKGLRRQAVDRSTTLDMGSIQTSAGILQLFALMGERGVNNRVMFVSPEVLIQKLLGLTEVITIDKMGSMATILSGQIASIFGTPIIPTRWVTADLAATGLYTGSGAKSGVIVADRSAYYRYVRRGVVIEVQKVIRSQHIELVLTVREGFDTPDESAAKNVAFGFNWL